MSLNIHSEEKGGGGASIQRSSSRQYRGNPADNKSSIENHHLDAIDPYERKSFDSKGKQAKLIMTAMHPKHNPHNGIPKGAHALANSHHHSDLIMNDTDQHHLPTITPNNYTSAIN